MAETFAKQMEYSCHRCGMPTRQQGTKAMGGLFEILSPEHADLAHFKDKKREFQVTTEAGPQVRDHATDYIENGQR
jgi:hypothetical protein